MRFNIDLNGILASKKRIKVLQNLFNAEASMSERELSRIVKVSHMSINRLMKELAGINLVSSERIGTANLWRLNRESYAYKVFSRRLKEVSSTSSPFEHLKKSGNPFLQEGWKNFVQWIVLLFDSKGHIAHDIKKHLHSHLRLLMV